MIACLVKWSDNKQMKSGDKKEDHILTTMIFAADKKEAVNIAYLVTAGKNPISANINTAEAEYCGNLGRSKERTQESKKDYTLKDLDKVNSDNKANGVPFICFIENAYSAEFLYKFLPNA